MSSRFALFILETRFAFEIFFALFLNLFFNNGRGGDGGDGEIAVSNGRLDTSGSVMSLM